MTDSPDLKRWGEETLDQIRADFYLPKEKLYAEDATLDGEKGHVAYNWSCGVLLSALNAGARMNSKYKPWLREFADASRRYWQNPGFDVLPVPKDVDRYYDDNAWMALALIETSDVLKDPKYLKWAEETVDWVLTAWDERLGGGVYWREQEKKSKNTCANAPTALACANLYAFTHKARYLVEALRIYDWTKRTLQDPATHLYWDHIALTGHLDKTTWSYNTALMIRAGAELAKITGEKRFATEAAKSQDAAVRRWLNAKSGLIDDDMAFAHLLAEALAECGYKELPRYLIGLHDKARDANGHYGKKWSDVATKPRDRFRLIDQASAARALLVAALRG